MPLVIIHLDNFSSFVVYYLRMVAGSVTVLIVRWLRQCIVIEYAHLAHGLAYIKPGLTLDYFDLSILTS